MLLTVNEIAKAMDLSCVRTYHTKADIKELVESAIRYKTGQVSVLQWHLPLVKDMVKTHAEIHVVGNVSFPSGSDSASLKVIQTKEMVATGCDEVDMVINVGKLRSGDFAEVEEEIKLVVGAADGLPVKVILELPYLNAKEIEAGCEMCIRAGATFVKTGSGWVEKGTTVEDIKFLKSIVGDRIKIKAAGGIRDLDTLVGMYREGASRFGVNLKSGKSILDECNARGGSVTY
jgi:deoxyribose-phosphate aldolase